jgi:hypothetical protein
MSNILKMKVEVESVEARKIGDTVFEVHECYVHTGARYPERTQMYLQDRLEPGNYIMTVAVGLKQGKLAITDKQFQLLPEK